MKSSITITNKTSPAQFQQWLLAWFDQHGRKHLPWQHNKTPYRVWVSEIMLQQTQVSTVISYFENFMRQFPTLASLAQATEDAVLHLWAGLGYYSRARNLHRAAKTVMTEFAGCFPETVEDLQTLSGIGRSTAGAIRSIAFNQPAVILDGNVKRVLARFFGVTEPVNVKDTENKLWAMAEHYTPTQRVADYTQAIMDLGATLCTRSKPQCHACPFAKHCIAHVQGMVHLLPQKKRSPKIPTRAATFLLLQTGSQIFLQKRPSPGIWGGLWSLPEIAGEPEPHRIRLFCRQQLRLHAENYQTLDSFRHTFSHYHLMLHPVLIKISRRPIKVMDETQQIWYNLAHPESLGLPKPIQRILENIDDTLNPLRQTQKRSRRPGTTTVARRTRSKNL
jgi:A/G-specific adenine glycosylase